MRCLSLKVEVNVFVLNLERNTVSRKLIPYFLFAEDVPEETWGWKNTSASPRLSLGLGQSRPCGRHLCREDTSVSPEQFRSFLFKLCHPAWCFFLWPPGSPKLNWVLSWIPESSWVLPTSRCLPLLRDFGFVFYFHFISNFMCIFT